MHTDTDRVNVQRVSSSVHIAHAVMRHGDQVTIGPRHASVINVVITGKPSSSNAGA